MFSYRRANYINLSDGSLLKFNGNSFEPVFIAENLPADIVNICDISNGNLRIAGYRSGIFDCVGTKCSLNAFTLNPLYKIADYCDATSSGWAYHDRNHGPWADYCE